MAVLASAEIADASAPATKARTSPHLFTIFIFSLIFFGITALLAIRPGKVVDIIGKFLTPVLLLALIVMCVKGIVSPLGPVAESSIPGQEVRTGLTFGYQTMDALLGVPLSVIVIKAVVDKGYEGRKACFPF